MALTKTARSIVASQSSTAGVNGSINLTAVQGGLLINARVVNGATPPSTGCLITVNTSNDGTTWRKFATYRAAVVASATYDWPILLPPEAMYAQVDFGSTSQAVTVEALGQELTSAA